MRQPPSAASRGDRITIAVFRKPLLGKGEQSDWAFGRHGFQPANRGSHGEPGEHVAGGGVVKEASGRPACIDEEIVGIRSSIECDHGVVLAVHDRQRYRTLLGLKCRLGIGRWFALEDNRSRDREGAFDRVGAVHQEAISEEPALRMPADEIVLDGINALQLVEGLPNQGGALAIGAGKPRKVLRPTKLTYV